MEHGVGKFLGGDRCCSENNSTCLYTRIGLVVPSTINPNRRKGGTNGVGAESLEEGLLYLSVSFAVFYVACATDLEIRAISECLGN